MNLTEPEKIALAIIERDIAITKARLLDANSTMNHARALYDKADETIRHCKKQIADLQERAKSITTITQPK